ncbi:zinc metalloprotease HtpX [Pseudocitrobacter corydidari]|uniref:Protease HtpX n=1 Tax=Pseudocitrobacter corydidari TaxID=2891570 RepID=A0ABY3SCC2_9ENTR|nr:zinc metalloprotease HtpX [Pseudocitrobacter corydidari]MEB4677254.1 zinc metalloprotease HtpX [Enterobacteriaceae bacterium G50]UGS43519.1 Protease HtpX [Pseudocitrobacter corydidari]
MLFEEIAHNKRNTFLLVIIFFLLLVEVGAAMGFLLLNNIFYGVGAAVVISILYILIMIYQGSAVVMWMNGGKEITDREQAHVLFETVEDMANVAGVPVPRIFIIDDASPNAFATGTSPEKAAVAVTRGLLESLERYELEGVIAHEMAHVRNYDIRLATIAVALVSAITLMSSLGKQSLFFGGGKNRKSSSSKSGGGSMVLYIAAFVFLLLAPVVATIVRLTLSRNREFLADATAVELTRNPEGLIAALEKISGRAEMIERVDSASQSLWFSSPLKADRGKTGMFDTHPSIDARIERLKAM